MKWIGHHIWDFISRFRSKIYLEDVDNAGSDTDAFLVKKADGEIAIRTGAEVLSDIGASSEATDLEFNGDTANGVLTYGGATQIDVESTLTYDGNALYMTNSTLSSILLTNTTNNATDGHLEFYNSKDGNAGVDGDDCGTLMFYGNNNAGGSAEKIIYGSIRTSIEERDDGDEAGIMRISVATSNDSTSNIQQALTATGHATDNTVDIGLGYGTTSLTTIAGDLTTLGDDISMSSANSGKPLVELKSTNTTRTTSSELKFLKDAANVEDGEMLGKISFHGDNDAGTPEVISYAEIVGMINDMTDGAEEGLLTIRVASHDGELQPGLFMVSGDAEDEVDVTIGNGATSLTTIAGNLTITSDLTVSGTTTTINTTNLNVEDKNITLNYNASGDTSGTANGAGITIQDAVDASNDASLTWVAATDKFSFSHAVEINNGASGGTTALAIDNDDIDQVALNIDGANTTAHLVNLDAPDLTTGSVLDIRADALTSGSAINLLVNDTLTTSATKSLIKVDYNKSGVTAGAQTSITTGLEIDMRDSATNDASGATSTFGAAITLDAASDQGAISQTGLYLSLTDADTGNKSTGIYSLVEDGGEDFKAVSSANQADYFTIATGEDGETTFTTVENGGGSTAHMNFNADGDIILDPGGNKVVKLNVDDGNVDGTGPGLNVHAGSEALPFFVANAESGNFSNLYLFEEGGATMADYFYISTASNGEATIGTVDAAGADASLSFSIDGDVSWDLNSTGNFSMGSDESSKPLLEIKNTHTDSQSRGEIKFLKDAADTGPNEFLGAITFYGEDSDGNKDQFGEILGGIVTATSGEEGGVIDFKVASHDGEMVTGLQILDGNAEDEIDARIASGTSSLTTISGNLNINGDTFTSAGNLTLDTVGDLSLDPHTDKDIFFKENGTERIQWHLDATPTMEVTGGFDIDCSSNIVLDANGGTGIIQHTCNYSIVTSSVTEKPHLIIKNTTNDSSSSRLVFEKDRGIGNDAVVNDDIGIINFVGRNDNNESIDYAKIKVEALEVDDTDEAGRMEFQVAESNGTTSNLTTGLKIEGSDNTTDGEVNVTIAAGYESLTTVSGNFKVTRDASLDKRKFEKTSGSVGKHNGDVVYIDSGTATTVLGKIYYFNDSGSWTIANADAMSDAKGMLAVALGTDPDVDGMLLRGMVTLVDILGTTEDEGKHLFLSTTDGTGTVDKPTSSTHIVRILGYLLDSANDQVWFNPDNTFIKIA